MKMYARDYRVKAHEACRPLSSQLALIYLVYAIILGVLCGLTVIVIGAIGLLLVAGPITFGWILICKRVYAKKTPRVADLFMGFNRFGDAFLLYLLSNIYISLWTLFFIIPGIIKIYSYAMAPFILFENPDMSADDAITKSCEIMDGHRWELFCLEFSYIGWAILCLFTFGILIFWVGPRMQVARYAFYLNISEKSEKKRL